MDAVRIDAEQLDLVAREWDLAVDRTPDADEFCAASAWSFSAAASFEDAGPAVVVGDGRAFAGLRLTRSAEGHRLLVGLDPIWGFATPIVGDPLRAAQLLDARLRLEDHDAAYITGQSEDSALTAGLVHVLGDRRRLLRGPTEQRLRADLSAGADAWFARRSPRFRQRLRRIERDAEDAGIDVVDISALAPDIALDRIVAVEARSWKGSDGTGLADPTLAEFYRRMTWRLAAADQLRLLVARLDDRDVGFVLGGTRGATYRGLQLSHERDVAPLGIGHLLQWHQIQNLEGTGIAVYDLGMDMAYKRRWADRVDETMAVVIAP